MTLTTRPPTLPALREALRAEFGEKVRLSRGHEGALRLRVISDRFEAAADAFEIVREALATRGLELPEPTLAVLKAPADLEPGQEELLLGPLTGGTPTWADALALEPEVPPASLPSSYRTVAFWGLKGGVGRTTALAHVATILGRRQVVLALDLDLDSPGLVGTFALEDKRNGRPRFDDLLRRAGDAGVSMEVLQAEVKRALQPGKETSARVHVLGPEQADVAFVAELAGSLTPSALYRGHGATLRRFVDAAVRAAGADLLLIDARSGYSDESAMAVLDLADEVVVFASPSPSTFPSLAPAIEALERSRQARGRPRLVHFATGMLPGNEEVRRRIVTALVDLVEGVQARLSEELETPVEERPPAVVPMRIDYTSRIVENDGLILRDGLDGYRDLADSLLPPAPGPSGAPVDQGWAAKVIVEVCRFFEDHPSVSPETEDLLFIPPLCLQEFSPASTTAVLGDPGYAGIGTGKSALRRRMLRRPEEYQQQSTPAAPPFDTVFIPAYAQSPRDHEREPLLSQRLLERLDRDLSLSQGRSVNLTRTWADVWSALLPWLVARGLALDVSQTKLGPPLERLLGATSDDDVLAAVQELMAAPEALRVGLDSMLSRASAAQKNWILLFDDLDLLFGRSLDAQQRRNAMVAGLLTCEASWLRRSQPDSKGCLLFAREDTIRASMLAARAVHGQELQTFHQPLHWIPLDMLRLVVHTLLVASPTFAEVAHRYGATEPAVSEGAPEQIGEVLKLIWGERMDDRDGRRSVISSICIALQDANGHHHPGPILALLRHAFEMRRTDVPATPPLLAPAMLRAALPAAGEERAQEIRRAAIEEELRSLDALHGEPNLEEPERLRRSLGGRGAPADAIERLASLGVVGVSAPRDRTGLLRVADLYALAPSLGVRRVHR